MTYLLILMWVGIGMVCVGRSWVLFAGAVLTLAAVMGVAGIYVLFPHLLTMQ